jgi:hypothetical protein
MKSLALKFILIAVLSFAAVQVSAQNESTITIKSMTIVNGDTIVKEKTYHNQGNAIITDTTFDSDMPFLYFNRDYNLDTNFDERFSENFGDKIQEFLKNFNNPDGHLLDQNFDFFNKGFSFGFDSSLMKPFREKIKPEPENLNKEKKIMPEEPALYDINAENIVSSTKPSIKCFNVVANQHEGTLKVSFSLDEKNQTLLRIGNSENKVIYKEKIPKSKGMYTRLFDMTVYEPGTYYLTVVQGKKQNKSQIIFRKNGI